MPDHGQLVDTLVRDEVERTVLDPAEVEAELHGLCEALVQAEGRVRVSFSEASPPGRNE